MKQFLLLSTFVFGYVSAYSMVNQGPMPMYNMQPYMSDIPPNGPCPQSQPCPLRQQTMQQPVASQGPAQVYVNQPYSNQASQPCAQTQTMGQPCQFSGMPATQQSSVQRTVMVSQQTVPVYMDNQMPSADMQPCQGQMQAQPCLQQGAVMVNQPVMQAQQPVSQFASVQQPMQMPMVSQGRQVQMTGPMDQGAAGMGQMPSIPPLFMPYYQDPGLPIPSDYWGRMDPEVAYYFRQRRYGGSLRGPALGASAGMVSGASAMVQQPSMSAGVMVDQPMMQGPQSSVFVQTSLSKPSGFQRQAGVMVQQPALSDASVMVQQPMMYRQQMIPQNGMVQQPMMQASMMQQPSVVAQSSYGQAPAFQQQGGEMLQQPMVQQPMMVRQQQPVMVQQPMVQSSFAQAPTQGVMSVQPGPVVVQQSSSSSVQGNTVYRQQTSVLQQTGGQQPMMFQGQQQAQNRPCPRQQSLPSGSMLITMMQDQTPPCY